MQPIPPHLTPSRYPKRATYDRDAINAILDEALVCTISFTLDNKPFAIPTGFVRHEDKIYIHGSVGSHFIREIEKGLPVCISVTLIDAIVVAKSAFNHSVNYRSVILFGTPEKIEDVQQKIEAFRWLTEKFVPNSWDYLRPIRENEVRKTTVLAFSLDEASAKVRTGMTGDDEDKEQPIWSGIIPLETRRLAPVTEDVSEGIPLPPHLKL
ncbi:pyridoxamine 5'-phosphate oxidase family protein [Chitinophaga sp. G-6-1-13]|uniref:Pyridoxamine 5'-phosphate oxidase family protein n=1 Tax=Chitinophaga fulva TaxID=2728842 RepID=A0A848GML2_9BACT|nr:pyridoxamine 5'-phosphate oxidase family protein [Chitinophaga fulva]NML38033.1 pyridoxamine 5'-phosphate oxidase family protein [Chitinophaga fulva]